jgi:hypothetical protein
MLQQALTHHSSKRFWNTKRSIMATTDASEWEKHVDDETQTPYYHNIRTGETSWEEPEGFVEASPDESATATAKPPRWRRYIDDSNGKPYYYDEANDVTQWEEPEGDIKDASGETRWVSKGATLD